MTTEPKTATAEEVEQIAADLDAAIMDQYDKFLAMFDATMETQRQWKRMAYALKDLAERRGVTADG